MIIISRKSIDFPSLGFAVSAGVPTELPDNKEVREAVLAHPCVKEYVPDEKPSKGKEEKKTV